MNPVLLPAGVGIAILIYALTRGKPAAAAPTDSGIASPFPDVSDAKWKAFVQKMALAPADKVNSKGFYGMFQMGVRRLVDLGIMANHKKTETGWTGDWVKCTQKEFLTNPRLQYAAFADSMKRYRPYLQKEYGATIGKSFEGKLVTMSGLLGTAHMAGGAGVGNWLKTPDYRKKFTHVTDAYLRTTGIF